MKKIVLLFVLCWLVLLVNNAVAQLKGTCSTCFESQIVKATKVDAECTDYQIRVFYNGHCEHDLSHFTVAVPSCATISNLSNNLNFANVIGYDPTTGLTGFKIDSVTDFCTSSRTELLISFRLCANSSCAQLQCWSTQVAYKAGNCFELDSIKAPCTGTGSQLKAHLEKKNISCYGVADGQLQAIVDEGVSPFQYSWSNGATQSSIIHLSAGTYSVTIRDNTGASLSLSETISQPDSITVSSQITDASCSGQANGSIVLAVSGGTSPYTYLWSNGSTASSLNNILSGNYSVTVTDSAGCSAHKTFTVADQKKLAANVSSQMPSCGQLNGSISVAPSGGTEPYTYLWSNGSTSSSIADVGQGSYSIKITDAEGCSITTNYFLRENNTLRLSYSVSPTSCLDDSSGAINLNVSGGTSPYTYVWSNGSSTEDISGLTSGIYTATVTDSLGCQQTARVFVFKKTFEVSSQVTQPLCASDTTGSISLSSSGGTGPYQYNWSTGDTTSLVQNLPSGNYSVTVTDSTGCSKTLTYFIVSPSVIQASLAQQAVSCSSFAIDLSVTGGTAPYQYQWSNGAVTEDITGLTPGDYSVTITDAHGCTLTKQTTIDSSQSWSCSITPMSQVINCNSFANRIFTPVADADSYTWEITSTDGSWQIETGAANDTLVFTAGNANTTATFRITIVKNGCTQTCEYTVGSCTSSGSGGNNEGCGDCFSSTITKKSEDSSCITYLVNVTTDGNCKYDLSHFVVDIPCGEITNYSDSGGWPLVIGRDPTTGLTGLKVDNVSGFGKSIGAFTLRFTVCCTSECSAILKDWNPVVAYKAGQCIAYDTLQISDNTHTITTASVYPNPFKDLINVEVTTDVKENASIELYDQFGRLACAPVSVPVESGKNSIPLNAEGLAPNMYFYRIHLSQSNAVFKGRILKNIQ